MTAQSETQRQRERFFSVAGQIIGWTFAFFLLTVVVAIFGGEYFSGYLELIGLDGIYTRESGVYADCSLEENKASRYCQNKQTEIDRSWKELDTQGTRPFSLSENH